MTDHYQESAQTWDKVAALYAATFMHLELYNDTYDALCDRITKREPDILEVGCGPGNITRYLLARRPDFRILGIDTSPNMIALAQQHNPAAHFRVMDARDISKLEPAFDGIICGFCLPYLSDADCMSLMQDCRHLLTDGGVLYLSFVEGDPAQSGYQTGSSGDRLYFYYHRLDILEKGLREAGFGNILVTDKPYTRKDGSTELHRILIATG